MQHEVDFLTVKEQVAALNYQARHFEPVQVLELAVERSIQGRIVLVSSFGAESVVLLHMVSQIDKSLPVLFIDTQMLFEETLTYQLDVAQHLGLSDVRRIQPDLADIADKDPDGLLNQHNKDACCALRKTRPLEQVLGGFDTWITGRKRFQSGARAALEVFENDADRRIKVNPLAGWQPKALQAYIETHQLPRHPMIARGFASIGCAPCTSAVKDGEDARAGRWRDSDKTECGIHFSNGKMVRTPLIGGISS
ncbi:phosphoadenosine phosphosulfate reductase [Marinosulfonomonas sp. PRT-SC04]|nr:phosphoadenosine phosphosulfate reductase [Marinosulfonomonas sp. PRT-SC04]